MKRIWLIAPLLLCLTAGTCTIPVNQTLLSDAQLINTGLAALVPFAPVGDQALISDAQATVQADLADLQSGGQSGATFASLVKTTIDTLAPKLLIDLKANATAAAGVAAVKGVADILLTDLAAPAPKAAPTAALAVDPRSTLSGWIATAKR